MAQESESRVLLYLLVIVWIAVAMAALLPGASYYRMPVAQRAFSQQHQLFAPTGRIGHGYGLIGAALMVVGVVSYAIRKRWRLLQRAGKLKHWLQFHIFCCTLGPFLVLLHTSFKFGGIVAISFYSMVMVVASGVFGRYVYVRIPKALNGQFQTLEQMRAEHAVLHNALQAHGGLAYAAVAAGTGAARPIREQTLIRVLFESARLEATAQQRVRSVRGQLLRAGVPHATASSLTALLRKQDRLERQIAFVQPFQKLFRYWHVFHLPFAIIMFVVLALHVAVAIAFGYGWPY